MVDIDNPLGPTLCISPTHITASNAGSELVDPLLDLENGNSNAVIDRNVHYEMEWMLNWYGRNQDIIPRAKVLETYISGEKLYFFEDKSKIMIDFQ